MWLSIILMLKPIRLKHRAAQMIQEGLEDVLIHVAAVDDSIGNMINHALRNQTGNHQVLVAMFAWGGVAPIGSHC